jgi:hypothetical protein
MASRREFKNFEETQVTQGGRRTARETAGEISISLLIFALPGAKPN